MKTKEEQINDAFDKYERNFARIEQFTDKSEFEGVPDWGSCQYDSAANTYAWVLEIMEILGLDGFEKAFSITHTGRQTQEEFLDSLHRILLDEASDSDDDREKPMAIPKRGDLTIEKYFEITQSYSYDLWSAAVIPLKDFEMKYEHPTPRGEENFFTGVACAYVTKLFGTTPDCFSGFDT